MTNFLNRLFYAGLKKEDYLSVKHDITEENRKNIILYSTVIVIGMSVLLILSMLSEVLVSSRSAYITLTFTN